MHTTTTGQASSATYIGKLEDTQLPKVSETVMCCILVDNEGDILHGFGTEPLGHDERGVCLLLLLEELF